MYDKRIIVRLSDQQETKLAELTKGSTVSKTIRRLIEKEYDRNIPKG